MKKILEIKLKKSIIIYTGDDLRTMLLGE